MKWVTWDQAAAIAAVCAVAMIVLRRRRPTRVGEALLPAFRELGLLAVLYTLWRLARELPLENDEGAIERARDIVGLQNALRIPSELRFQQWVIGHEWLEFASNAYYAIVHVPATVAFLIWLFVRHRERYPRWRTALVIVTALSLVIRFQRVAPPRFLTDLGFIDLSRGSALDVYGPVGSGVSDQFAAMPSIHVAWAGVVTFGIIAVTASRWRWLAVVHLVLTIYAVTVTGHHWWLDGIVALALLGLALPLDSGARRLGRSRRAATSSDEHATGGEQDLTGRVRRLVG